MTDKVTTITISHMCTDD